MKKKPKTKRGPTDAFLLLYQSFREHFAKAYFKDASPKWTSTVLAAQLTFVAAAIREYGYSTCRSKAELATFFHRAYSDMVNETLKGVSGVNGFVVVDSDKPGKKT